MLETVFWITSLLVVWPWIAYPLVLHAARRRPVSGGAGGEDGSSRDGGRAPVPSEPAVTLIVSAFNEEAVIGRRLDNARALAVPGSSLEILVVCDASTDRTAAIVEAHAAEDVRVRLVRMPDRGGKALGLNRAVPTARGDIVVFTDANAMYEPNALVKLLEPFADPDVGYTVGSALYCEDEVEAVNFSEGLYWRYELWIKRLESDFHSVVGGDGAIYAIRRELYRPLTDIDISDFVNPLQIVAAGYRGVFVPEARSYETGTGQFFDEFRRKRRIVNRSWGAVRRHFELFSWRCHATFLFMLISHKVVRWFSTGFVAVALATSAALAAVRGGGLYAWLFAAIALSVALALIGWWLDRTGRAMPKPIYVLYYFYLVGVASLLGILDELRGVRRAVWTPIR